jgi:DNA helicase-2/ATP-dependent DNA helicase PcrA
MYDILSGLNPAQKEAAQHTEGPVLILAGAGSGKTKTLTHRLAYLIVEKKISPERILAVTFTNKAATEMKERITKLLDGKYYLPWVGTFHSICVRLLRKEGEAVGLLKNFIIYDDYDQKQVMKRVIAELNLDSKQFNPQSCLGFISGAKNEMMDPNTYEKYANSFFQEQIVQIYKLYQRKLRENNAVDFDDILMLTVEALMKDSIVLERYQNLFMYILVDEYQDTNSVQYKLCKLLAGKRENLCVVGDDYQAIYSWRGANFRNILNFEKDYPNAFVVKLEQNYRSTKNILEGADAIIKKNINRTEKNLWTENEAGSPVIIYKAINEIDEAEFMVQEAKSLARLSRYGGYKSIAILYRTNAQSRIVEEMLLNWKVPYRIFGGIRFYERKEVKDALAYLRLVSNLKDTVSLERVLNAPTRGIGDKSVALIVRAMPNAIIEKDHCIEGLTPKAQASFKEFKDALLLSREEFEQSQDLEKLLDNLMERSGYLRWIDDGTPEAQAKIENIQELKSVIAKGQSLDEFLEGVSLVSDVDNYDSQTDAVTLMTLHSSKGLEFPIVFICGMEEGIFPHSRIGFDPNEIEEERRLCYVGITRAKERLYLLHAEERRLFGSLQINPPSRFINDLPEEITQTL